MYIRTATLAAAIGTALTNIPVDQDDIPAKGTSIWLAEISRDPAIRSRTVSEVRVMPDLTYRVALADYDCDQDRELFVSKSAPSDFFMSIPEAIERALELAQEYSAKEGLQDPVAEASETTMLLLSVAGSSIHH